jgi:hypothetical protein
MVTEVISDSKVGNSIFSALPGIELRLHFWLALPKWNSFRHKSFQSLFGEYRRKDIENIIMVCMQLQYTNFSSN